MWTVFASAKHLALRLQFSMNFNSYGGSICTHADPKTFGSLLKLLSEGAITSRVAKDLLGEVVFSGKDPYELATSRNLLQQNSQEALLPIIEQVISENPAVVDEYKAGKEASIQFLIGQGMKLSRGSANPAVLKSELEKKLQS